MLGKRKTLESLNGKKKQLSRFYHKKGSNNLPLPRVARWVVKRRCALSRIATSICAEDKQTWVLHNFLVPHFAGSFRGVASAPSSSSPKSIENVCKLQALPLYKKRVSDPNARKFHHMTELHFQCLLVHLWLWTHASMGAETWKLLQIPMLTRTPTSEMSAQQEVEIWETPLNNRNYIWWMDLSCWTYV